MQNFGIKSGLGYAPQMGSCAGLQKCDRDIYGRCTSYMGDTFSQIMVGKTVLFSAIPAQESVNMAAGRMNQVRDVQKIVRQQDSKFKIPNPVGSQVGVL